MMETRLFVQRRVGQLMSGYEDDLLEMAQISMPDKIKSNQFGFLMGVRAIFVVIKIMEILKLLQISIIF